jgi:hypothetical protein
LNVGQSVPVIGSASYPSTSAAPVQAVTYEDAGVIFDVAPSVKDDVIDINPLVRLSPAAPSSPAQNPLEAARYPPQSRSKGTRPAS